MSKDNIITGLDIGTGSIKGLMALKRQSSSDFEVLAQAQKFSLGIRKGAVVNPEEVSQNITFLLTRLQQQSGQKINEVYVNLGGSHLFCLPSRGSVVVSRADQKISQEDIDRVLQSARALSLPHNKEILEVFPKEFIVDGEKDIKQPLDMQGVRLEVEALALCAFSPYVKNLTDAVLNSETQIGDVVPSPLAASKAVLTPQQKELGVVLVDIGTGTTSLAAFNEGDLIYIAVIPVGSSHISQDIAVGFQTEMNIAEQLKTQFGTCILPQSIKGKKDKIVLKDFSSLVFSRKTLTKIISARVSEIFELVQKELKKISPQVLLPSGIVLTGGGAKLSKIVEIAKKELKLPVRLGFPQRFPGMEKDASMSAVCGLVMEGAEEDSAPGINRWKEIVAKFKKIFKVFVP